MFFGRSKWRAIAHLRMKSFSNTVTQIVVSTCKEEIAKVAVAGQTIWMAGTEALVVLLRNSFWVSMIIRKCQDLYRANEGQLQLRVVIRRSWMKS